MVAFFFFFFDDFAERLKSAMKKQNVTPVALAALAGVSLITVQRWLNSDYQPRYRNLSKVAHALHISTDFLCPPEE